MIAFSQGPNGLSISANRPVATDVGAEAADVAAATLAGAVAPSSVRGGGRGIQSPDGVGSDKAWRMLTVGLDDDHTVALWESMIGDWEDATLKGVQRSDKRKVLFAQFIGGTDNGPYEFVTGGINHMYFWTVEGRSLTHHAANFGEKSKVRGHPLMDTLYGIRWR